MENSRVYRKCAQKKDFFAVYPDPFEDATQAAPAPPECPFEKLFPSQLQRDDTFFMKLAFNQAIDAWRRNEVPIGAVIECGGYVVGAAHNQVAGAADPTAHAEILAITQAARAIGDWRLNGARLFVTKEPCPMCSGASIMARLKEVIYAVRDPKMGCLGGATSLHEVPGLNHRLKVRSGVLEAECKELLQTFFRLKRKDRPEVDGLA
ncbi:MAG: nucleoside deaminase [Opitutales bacterium]